MKFAAALSICVAALTSQTMAQNQQAPSNHKEIDAALGWMVGTWEPTDGTYAQIEVKWILDKQFIRGTVSTGNPLSEYLHVYIGWNPVEKQLTVAGFNNRGGQSVGKCTKIAAKEVHFAVEGVSASGPSKLTLVYSQPAKDKLIVEYRDWTINGVEREPMKSEMVRKKKD